MKFKNYGMVQLSNVFLYFYLKAFLRNKTSNEEGEDITQVKDM